MISLRRGFDSGIMTDSNLSPQVYNPETGARVVAGCVVLNQDKSKLLFISSTGQKKRWVLPKGGVELDEPDYKDSGEYNTLNNSYKF